MRETKALTKEEPTSKPINLRPTGTEINVTTNITIKIVKFFFDIDIGIVMLLHCALCTKLKHHTFPTNKSKNTVQLARMTVPETVPKPCTKRCKTLRTLAKCMVEKKTLNKT